MTSFVIISKDKEKRETFLKDFYKNHAIDPLDVTIISFDNSVKQNMQSIGIEDVKHMQKKVFLKPMKSKDKVVVLDDAQLLTLEAQNALLKVLEEPPLNTFIILATDTKEALLPTIISRCKIIQLEDEIKFSDKEKKEIETFIEELPKWGTGERLKKAEVLAKDKDNAVEWIEKVILVAREKMLEEARDTRGTRATLKQLQALHTTLKTTNANPRFAIENTLLSISA